MFGARLAHMEAQPERLDVEELSSRWWESLNAAQSALVSAGDILLSRDLDRRTRRLTGERTEVAHLLESLARQSGSKAHFSHLLIPPWSVRRLLGLEPEVTACVFNLDGVLVGSAVVHAAAWRETFDEFILARIERTGGAFAPFDPNLEYYRFIHGRPRLEGVRAFLESRGIRLPEGLPDDAPGAETVHGLANRKRDALLRRLGEHRLKAFEGSRHYLEIARDAGVHRAIVSASANAEKMLVDAGLSRLIEGCVDGNAMVAEHLRPKPAPDTLVAACRQLGVEPKRAAVFETTPAGIAAGRSAGFELVIGVDQAGSADALRAEGADRVITGLAELLDRRLAA